MRCALLILFLIIFINVFLLTLFIFLLYFTFKLEFVFNLSFAYKRFILVYFNFITLTSLFCFLLVANYCAVIDAFAPDLNLMDTSSCFHFLYFQSFYFPFIYIFLIITLLTLLFCVSFNSAELMRFVLYVWFIVLAGVGLFLTNSILFFFLFYEALLLPSFLILYNYAKTRKSVEAAYLMFFWTQFGALFLIFNLIFLFFLTQSLLFSSFSFFSFSQFQVNFLFVTLLIGFGVKLPIWPFYSWLPKAHVEASTNFSIFLSGVLVKFAFFGFFKYLLNMQIEPTFILVYPLLLVGILDASFKFYYQIDLKKLIAYSTIIEMHWLLFTLLNGQSILWVSTFCMLISHAFISANFFLLVDAVTRRFKTRLITEINGLNNLTPLLYTLILLMLVIFLGFPGSLFFVAEFLFFSYFFDVDFFTTLFLLFILYFFCASSFFKNWFFLLFGYSFYYYNGRGLVDLDTKELVLFGFIVVLLFWLGFSFQFFLF